MRWYTAWEWLFFQINQQNDREIVAYASKSLSSCEQKYSQIEKETLALVFAAKRFIENNTGINILLETDHKPFLQILQTKALVDLTPRLQRIRLWLARYSYNVVFTSGKDLILADCLSRNLLRGSKPGEDNLSEEIDSYVYYIIVRLSASSSMLNFIKQE